MASAKIINHKKDIVKEIVNNIKNSEAVIVFTYQGLDVSQISTLRNELKSKDGEVKIYKNTLVKRALDELNISLDGFMEGPNAIMFGKDIIDSIKILTKFAKDNKVLDIKTGIISGEVVNIDTINKYATIPSLEGLLTMFAGGLMEHVRNVAIALDLYAKKLEEK